MPEAVKVQCREAKGYEVYLITVPKEFVKKLGLKKGDILFAEIMEMNITSSRGIEESRKGIFYYKP